MSSAYTYEDYMKEPLCLSFERMTEIHQKISAAVDNDTEALEFYTSLIAAAANYANMRALWPTMEREEKIEKDSRRTSMHDSFIIKLHTLANVLSTQGKDTSWLDDLGNDTEGYGRKSLGDFACYLAFVNGINAR
ncbi:MAG: hypothetical protein LIP10_12280 [Clostridiales bacterium]|nr:hypothetical protein [Clostridiales bacterium]